jgi:hypothetical protein
MKEAAGDIYTYGLFNNDFNSSDYKLWHNQITGIQWIEKNVEPDEA